MMSSEVKLEVVLIHCPKNLAIERIDISSTHESLVREIAASPTIGLTNVSLVVESGGGRVIGEIAFNHEEKLVGIKQMLTLRGLRQVSAQSDFNFTHGRVGQCLLFGEI